MGDGSELTDLVCFLLFWFRFVFAMPHAMVEWWNCLHFRFVFELRVLLCCRLAIRAARIMPNSARLNICDEALLAKVEENETEEWMSRYGDLVWARIYLAHPWYSLFLAIILM